MVDLESNIISYTYDLRKGRIMVQVDSDCLKESDDVIDLEKGNTTLVNEEGSRVANATNLLSSVWNRFLSSNRSTKSEENVSSENHHLNGEILVDKIYRVGGEVALGKQAVGKKPKKNSCKKPPKPPRAPRPPSLDAADQKLIRELSKMAVMKRARIERIKALKRTKNAKLPSFSSNMFAFIITICFCSVIIWQGTNVNFHGSPESSMGARGGFISVQFYNASTHDDTSSASPINVEAMSGRDGHG